MPANQTEPGRTPRGGWSFHGPSLYLLIAEVVVGIAALVGIVLVATGHFPARMTAGAPVAPTPSPLAATATYLDAAGVAGPDPFAGDVFAPMGPVAPTDGLPVTVIHGTVVTAQSGDTPGLYGGSMSKLVADKEKQLRYLQENPDKAAAFCEALNSDPTLFWTGGSTVTPGQLPAYFDELTPVLLTHDTLVTNHGYKDGRPTPRTAVLQAGQMVLVDRHGVPRVRCECGNPLAVGVPTTYQVAAGLSPVLNFSLLGIPAGLGNEGKTVGFGGMTICTEHVWNRLCSVYPAVANFFAGALAPRGNWTSDHPFGRAFDYGGSESLMQPSAAWLAQNYYALNLKYIIHDAMKFKNGKWVTYDPPKALKASASYETAYHFDHVHVSVKECAAYSGQAWPQFAQQPPVQVKAAAQQISAFTLIDPSTGQTFMRAAGSSGDLDVPSTTTVTTVPASGELLRVPGVEGMELEEARATLARSGLNVTVTYEETTIAPAGRVLDQIPAPGGEILTNGFVELVVAKEPAALSTTTTSVTTLVRVPSVKGLRLSQARAQLEGSGLQVRITYKEITDTGGASDQVLDQRPAAGTNVAKGSVVELVLPKTAGVKLVKVPNVVGMSSTEAESLLADHGLQVTHSYVATADHPSGRVVDQTPPAGMEVSTSSVIEIVVATQPSTTTTLVTVPAVEGMDLARARRALASYGLEGTITYKETADYPSGRVIQQRPEAGTQVARGTVVELVVAQEPATTTTLVQVPSVMEMYVDRAKALIAKAGLEVFVTYRQTATVEPGLVIGQDPGAGAQVPPGTVVTILVATEVRVSVPYVVGMLAANAQAALVEVGLSYHVTYQSSTKVAAGYVISQSPVSGSEVALGTVVEIYVAMPVLK